MDLLLTYDVNTTTPAGRRRLRKVAKLCEGYGLRVQHSVFEIVADDRTLPRLLDDLNQLINQDTDSIRIYALPKDGFNTVRPLGTARIIQHRDDLVL
ncbi:CRISPR-associated endonuclease Cas2 [Streptomyces mayteni]